MIIKKWFGKIEIITTENDTDKLGFQRIAFRTNQIRKVSISPNGKQVMIETEFACITICCDKVENKKFKDCTHLYKWIKRAI